VVLGGKEEAHSHTSNTNQIKGQHKGQPRREKRGLRGLPPVSHPVEGDHDHGAVGRRTDLVLGRRCALLDDDSDDDGKEGHAADSAADNGEEVARRRRRGAAELLVPEAHRERGLRDDNVGLHRGDDGSGRAAAAATADREGEAALVLETPVHSVRDGDFESKRARGGAGAERELRGEREKTQSRERKGKENEEETTLVENARTTPPAQPAHLDIAARLAGHESLRVDRGALVGRNKVCVAVRVDNAVRGGRFGEMRGRTKKKGITKGMGRNANAIRSTHPDLSSSLPGKRPTYVKRTLMFASAACVALGTMEVVKYGDWAVWSAAFALVPMTRKRVSQTCETSCGAQVGWRWEREC
jgi:hypothetical protein